jgi:hypothetical protein
MKDNRVKWVLVCLCFLQFAPFPARSQPASADEPLYDGKPLCAWADQVLARRGMFQVVKQTNRAEIKALRAIGTNAIPWLLIEMNSPMRADEQPPGSVGLSSDSAPLYHQLRARAVFWALGELAFPAIQGLVDLLPQQPVLGASSLAGIGSPALPAIERILTNSTPTATLAHPEAEMVTSALGGLFVAIDVGRTSPQQAEYLLPVVRSWTTAHGSAGYWARGLLEKMDKMKARD